MGVDEINAVSDGLVVSITATRGTDPNIASTTVDKYLTGDYRRDHRRCRFGCLALDRRQGSGQRSRDVFGSNTTGVAQLDLTIDPYYFRTAPSDNLQAPALADVIAGDAYTASVAVLWRNDDYGVGFGELLAAELDGVVVLAQAYDAAAGSFATEAQAVVASGAEALAMITFEEGGQLLLDLESAGFTGQVYVADGFKDTVGPDQLGGNTALLEGIKGTAPSASPENGEATFPTAARSCVPRNGNDLLCTEVRLPHGNRARRPGGTECDPAVFINEIGNVTKGGEKCSLFEDCFNLLMTGADIDYDGASVDGVYWRRKWSRRS